MDVIRIDQLRDPAVEAESTLAGLDAVRAGAMLAVVGLHAGVPYLRHPMPGLIWPVMDSQSAVVDVIFWNIEIFIMPLFFLMAGFLMWRSSRRRLAGQLIRSRAKRLLIPLGFGALFILPIDLYIWTIGLVSEGTVAAIKLKSFKFDPPVSEQIWGLSHLWFLLYMFLYVVVAAGLIRLSFTGLTQRVGETRLRPAIVAVILGGVAVVTLIFAPEVVWGFQHAFLPVPSKWMYCGLFFSAGCWLAHFDIELKWASASSHRMLAMAAILLLSSFLLGTWSLEQTARGATVDLTARGVLAVLTVAAASTASLGLLGVSVRHLRSVPRPVRYVASASFWVYLIHHPVLGLIHLDIKWLWPDGSAVVKHVVCLTLSTLVSLLLYESLVRRTWLGDVLGFRQAPPTTRGDSTATVIVLPETPTDQRRAA